MTEGISKEYLEGKLLQAKKYNDIQIIDLLKYLITECTDIDPWLPIDENTPKDKYILIFDYMAKSRVVAKFDDKIGMYLDRNRVAVYATHYKLLPEDPK